MKKKNPPEENEKKPTDALSRAQDAIISRAVHAARSYATKQGRLRVAQGVFLNAGRQRISAAAVASATAVAVDAPFRIATRNRQCNIVTRRPKKNCDYTTRVCVISRKNCVVVIKLFSGAVYSHTQCRRLMTTNRSHATTDTHEVSTYITQTDIFSALSRVQLFLRIGRVIRCYSFGVKTKITI